MYPNKDFNRPARLCKQDFTFKANGEILKNTSADGFHSANVGHKSKDCRSKLTCYRCKRAGNNNKHHFTLHRFNGPTGTKPDATEASPPPHGRIYEL